MEREREMVTEIREMGPATTTVGKKGVRREKREREETGEGEM